jgi:hypothetical protein
MAIVIWSVLVVFSLGALEMAQENYFSVKARAFVKAKVLQRYGGDFELAMNSQGLVKSDVKGDSVWISRDTATLIQSARTIDQKLIGKNEGILAAPYLPGLYAVLEKQSPLWEIYFLLPRPIGEQEGMVQDLETKHINWALVCHHYVDERPELAFDNTHNVLWQ